MRKLNLNDLRYRKLPELKVFGPDCTRLTTLQKNVNICPLNNRYLEIFYAKFYHVNNLS